MDKKDKIKEVEEHWTSSSGKTKYLKLLNNEHISRNDAIEAKCADCNSGYVDGREDCKVTLCPLYPFMPYNKNKVKTRKPNKGKKE